MNFLNDALGRVPEYRAIENAVRQRKTPVAVTGLASIHKANILHTLLSAMSKKALFIAGDEAEATRMLEDLNAMGVTSAFYPLRDFSLRDTEGSSHEYERQRIEALTLLQTGQCTCIVTTIDAALQYVLPPKKLKERTVKLSAGQEISVDEIVRALVRCGYVRADQIDGTGQFARRGGIVDFYSPGGKAPVRVEFWGDEIDTISYFDAETQRRTDQITEVTISPAVEVVPDSMSILAKKLEAHAKTLRGKAAPAAKEVLLREADKLKNDLHIGCMDKYYTFVYETVATLFDYFDTDALLVFSEGSKLKERMRTTLWQWGEDVRGLLAEGVLCRGLDMYTETYEYALKRAEDTASVYMDAFARGSYDTPTKALVNMTVRQLSVWGGSTQLSDLFDHATKIWSWAPQISLPIFTGGANISNLRAAEARQKSALADYEAAIQAAFKDVADALAMEGTVERELSARRDFAKAAAESYRLATDRYKNGADSYLSVLDSQRTNFSAQQALITAELSRAASLITLYKAMGGASELAEPEGESK